MQHALSKLMYVLLGQSSGNLCKYTHRYTGLKYMNFFAPKILARERMFYFHMLVFYYIVVIVCFSRGWGGGVHIYNPKGGQVQ